MSFSRMGCESKSYAILRWSRFYLYQYAMRVGSKIPSVMGFHFSITSKLHCLSLPTLIIVDATAAKFPANKALWSLYISGWQLSSPVLKTAENHVTGPSLTSVNFSPSPVDGSGLVTWFQHKKFRIGYHPYSIRHLWTLVRNLILKEPNFPFGISYNHLSHFVSFSKYLLLK